MVTLPNIYKRNNLKFLIAVPLVLMVFGIILSSHLTLDTTLQGGVSITLQTNTTLSPQQISSAVITDLHVSNPTVQASPGGVQITFDPNQTLEKAQDNLSGVFTYDANYSTFLTNATTINIALQQSPGNQTLIKELSQANAGVNASLAGMHNSLNNELALLAPFIGTVQSTNNTPDKIPGVAENAYTNASTVYENRTIAALRSIVPFSSYSYEQVSPTLGQYFLGQLRTVILVAFILMALVAFAIFRSPIPSLTVVFGAGNDIIVALGAMALFKIPLGVASIGGLLMLLGYSMDTDVLTAIRILKRHEGTPEDRAYASMKTGLTMTTAAIISFGVMFVIAFVAYIPTYYEIAGVVLFGLIADVFTTWFGNASIILLYKKRKERV